MHHPQNGVERCAEPSRGRPDEAGLITWEVNVDSTICRAHQHAAGARRDGQAQKEPPGGTRTEPEDHGLGRSRGGFTTKIHLACEQGQRPLSLLVTAGQRGDSPQFTAVLKGIRVPRTGPGRPRVRPLRVRGDKAYFSRANRAYLRKRGIRCTIPEPTDQVANRKRRGEGRRAASGLRSRGLQGPARGRVRDQPAQAQPGGGHPVR
ncbi:transposase [Streptomyces sp. NPDC087908]|uniref:transposase n=1 Tax=Streptomyces sp. NPDC087908 TaxID=3365820 RepID=UPI00382E60EF